MKVLGNAVTGGTTYNGQSVDLPRVDVTARVTHRPWCVDCKTKHDADQLDRDGRCERCVHAAETRAAAAARRTAADDQVWVEAQKQHKSGERSPRRRPAATPKPRPAKASVERQAPTTASPAGPVRVQRTIDHTSKISKLESRRAQLADQLADVDARLTTLRTEHGTTIVTERARVSNRHNGPERIVLPGEEIAADYLAGATLGALAAKHGVSAPTISRALDDQGVQRRHQVVDYSQELIEQVRGAYVDEGLTQGEVATRLGVSTKVVQTAMSLGGIEARESAAERSKAGVGHPIKLQPEDRTTIVTRYQAGESAPAIARDFDVSSASVYHVLRAAGVEERHRTRSVPGQDGARRLRDRIDDLGVTTRAIKEWAVEQGLMDHMIRGIPSAQIVTAYAAAHPEAESA